MVHSLFPNLQYSYLICLLCKILGKYILRYTFVNKPVLNWTDTMNMVFFLSQVSWVRRAGDKMQLLSFGHHVYSTDQRYELLFKDPNDWQLRISYLNERDAGHYECQVSTHPPIAFTVYLAIIGWCHDIIINLLSLCSEKMLILFLFNIIILLY